MMRSRSMEKTAILIENDNVWRRKGYVLVGGVDEAGRGPLAGPVVAAAAVFENGVQVEGVTDSKKLSERKREELFEKIIGSVLTYGIGIVDHLTIDKINIYQASIVAMQEAVDGLQIKPNIILADGNSFRHKTLPFENIIDGDAKNFSIAAASIIAKVTRDRMMVQFHQSFPMYGFAKNKGYGTREHLEAIRKYGLSEIHRRSFRSSKNSDMQITSVQI